MSNAEKSTRKPYVVERKSGKIVGPSGFELKTGNTLRNLVLWRRSVDTLVKRADEQIAKKDAKHPLSEIDAALAFGRLEQESRTRMTARLTVWGLGATATLLTAPIFGLGLFCTVFTVGSARILTETGRMAKLAQEKGRFTKRAEKAVMLGKIARKQQPPKR